MDDTVEKFRNYVERSLVVIGYYDSAFLRYLYAIVFYAFSLTMLTGQFVGFINQDSSSARMEIVYFTNVILYAIFVYKDMKFTHDSLFEFMVQIFQPHQGKSYDDWRLKALIRSIKKSNIILPRFMIMVLLCCISYLLGWCFMPLLSGFTYNNKNFYIMPYNYQCTEEGGNRFPIPPLCSEKQMADQFIFFNTVSSIFTIWLVLMAFLWPMLFVTFIHFFVDANLAVLKEELQLLSEEKFSGDFRDEQNSPDEKDGNKINLYDAEGKVAMKNYLVLIIQFHQYFIR